MRIGKRVLVPPRPTKLTIYRENDKGEPDNIDFICGAVLDYTEFEKLCPQPKAPLKMNIKTGENTVLPNDPAFRKKLNDWSDLRIAWMCIQSLKATPDLEWDTVKYDDPETWLNWESELRSILTESEVDKLRLGIYSANAPTENRRQEALDVFSQLQAAEPVNSNSPQGELMNTPSSEPANVSV